MAPKRLYRSEHDRVIAGVAAGIGDYFSVDPTLVRIAFVFLAAAQWIGVLLYLACWLVIPSEGAAAGAVEGSVRDNAGNIAHEVRRAWSGNHGRSQFGAWLVGVGALFLLINLGIFSARLIGQLWPIILILLGLLMLNRSRD